jgi:hypothetical protein
MDADRFMDFDFGYKFGTMLGLHAGFGHGQDRSLD